MINSGFCIIFYEISLNALCYRLLNENKIQRLTSKTFAGLSSLEKLQVTLGFWHWVFGICFVCKLTHAIKIKMKLIADK